MLLLLLLLSSSSLLVVVGGVVVGSEPVVRALQLSLLCCLVSSPCGRMSSNSGVFRGSRK